jgi:D-Tyr-tRNAtyr deacylase
MMDEREKIKTAINNAVEQALTYSALTLIAKMMSGEDPSESEIEQARKKIVDDAMTELGL